MTNIADSWGFLNTESEEDVKNDAMGCKPFQLFPWINDKT